MKLALVSAICGLGVMSGAFAQTVLELDLGNNALATNGAGFTKIGTDNASIVNGSYYEFDGVAGSAYTLSFTNIGEYGGTGALSADGFYNQSGNGPAYFTLSGLPSGYTVTLYACWGWNGEGAGAKVIYGGGTNVISNPGTDPNPSTTTLQNMGRAVVATNGTVNGEWYGQGGLTSEGQIGAMILDIEPCEPVITMNGLNPMLVPINSTFHDPGATAVESCLGAALPVTTNGTVNTTTLGTYSVTYTAIADGHTISQTRTVNVVQSDFLNLDLANNDSVSTPAGFDRLNYSGANMSFSTNSVAGTTYTVAFTNVSGTWTGGGSTIDADGFYCNAGVTSGFSVSGLTPGSLVTLYACWAWDGAAHAAIITYAGETNLLDVGSDITAPSTTTFENLGTAVVDSTGVVHGTWTGQAGNQGQIGGMIFSIQAPVGHSLTVLPSGFTNNCGASVTFTAAASAGASFQWYNNLGQLISAATNATLALTDLHPSDSGNFKVVAYGTGWAVTNVVPVTIIDVAPPVMTMSGVSTMIVWLNSTFTDPGVTAYDSCAGHSLTVTTTGTVNTSVLGEYDLTYSATTVDGTEASLTRSVIVIDHSIQPDVQWALDFQSESDVALAVTGFTALPVFDIEQDLYGNVSVPDPTFTGSSYVLSFTNISSWSTSTQDSYGLSTAGFYNYGYTPATFTVSGLPAGVVVNIYAVYGWDGPPKAAQIVYGGETNILDIGIMTNSTEPLTEGDLQFIGSAVAIDGSVTGTWYGPGGTNTEGQIGGMIIDIQSIPSHSAMISPAVSTPQCGSNQTMTATVSGMTPFTYQWYDNHNNLISAATNATFTLVNVRPSSVGTYTVVASNAYGRSTNTAAIQGVTDTAPPVMTLNGVDPVVVAVNNGAYVDAGATAFDLCAQAYVAVRTSNPVDVTTIGTYTVTYTATTAAGNLGTLTRTVNVVPYPNDTLQLDFAPTGTVLPAPAGFTLVQNAAALTPGDYSFPNVAGSSYTLSFTNIGSYNTGNTNEPLVTEGFYSYAANGPAYFAIGNVPIGVNVTLYAIYAWNGVGEGADIFFGGANTQIADNGDPGLNPTLANFTKIGAATADSNSTVQGYWQGPAGPDSEGQVGAMVILIGPTSMPVAGYNQLSMPQLVNGAWNIAFLGAASAKYVLETTSSLQAPVVWTPVATNQTSSAGAVTFTVTPTSGSGFYRTHSLP